MFQKLSIVFRIFLVVLFIYSVLFALVGTIVVFRAHSYVKDIVEQVENMGETAPAMSRFMQDLVDSNPKVKIKHEFVPLDSISKNLQKAVIAGEDPAFYVHPGFDARSIAVAVNENVSTGKLLKGGSTITQQLAKNFFLTGERTWERKAKELGYALLMENELGKDRILELYLNYAQWGKSIFGCEAASRAYFNTSCSQLDMKQATDLAAMLPSPCNHTPETQDAFMEGRRKLIQTNLPRIINPD